MKEITKEIYRVDRDWFRVNEHRIVGDMGFTFQEADDTRSIEMRALIQSCVDCILSYEIGDFYEKDDKETFPIYIIQKTTAYLELEDDEDENQYDNDLQIWETDKWEDVYSLICCTPQYGEQLGVQDELKRLGLPLGKYILK